MCSMKHVIHSGMAKDVTLLDEAYGNDFALADRIAKVRAINIQQDLEHHGYVSFSGGKDSAAISRFIDEALPDNHIPRVFFNTGVEMIETVRYVKRMAQKDSRIVIVPPAVNLRNMLEKNGYPFKSKLHAGTVARYQRSGMTLSVRKYLGEIEEGYNRPIPHWLRCPDNMRYQFTPQFTLKVSPKCCQRLKKEPGKKWGKEHDRQIVMLGLHVDEGGVRSLNYHKLGRTCIYETPGQTKFSPFMSCSSKFVDWYVQTRGVELSPLYYPPYNAERTGCRGCPFNIRLKQDLYAMAQYYPADFKAACALWKPVYLEYIKLGRLPKGDMFLDYGY